jgi:hypothetical protein
VKFSSGKLGVSHLNGSIMVCLFLANVCTQYRSSASFFTGRKELRPLSRQLHRTQEEEGISRQLQALCLALRPLTCRLNVQYVETLLNI